MRCRSVVIMSSKEPLSTERVRAVVVGSINMDLSLAVPTIPAPGETVLSSSAVRTPGGKGANQAVAMARLGAEVRMVGAVGEDADGAALLASLESAGVRTEWIARRPGTPSGLAIVCVDPGANNAIVVASGANSTLSPEDVRSAAGAFERSGVLVCQLETPAETVIAAQHSGREVGALVVLNAAPAKQVPEEMFALTDVLVVNEIEATMFAPGAGPEDSARRLLDKGPKAVVVTLGGEGCLVVDEQGAAPSPAYRVKPVDTTGAGDCFTGGLAFGLSKGRPLREAVKIAQAAAAIAVTRVGAQAAMPTMQEVGDFLRERGFPLDG